MAAYDDCENSELSAEHFAIDHFGVCPECGRNDGYLNVGRRHWFICHEHAAKWSVGWNLLSSWQYESEGDWIANDALLLGYADVEPLHHVEEIAAVFDFRPSDFAERPLYWSGPHSESEGFVE